MNIYIHIPFCHSKCAYCAFLSHCDMNKEDEYTAAVCNEISKLKSIVSNSVDTIYFGGGTPSLVKAENIAKIIHSIAKKFDLVESAEITLECNPEDIDAKKLEAWENAGVNRLSIGIQTFNDDVRRDMGRSLTTAETINRVKLAQEYFKNVGVDLISGLPKDSFAPLKKAGNFLGTLSHISLYDLETDNDSVLGKDPTRYSLPSEESSAKDLLESWKLIKSLGFEQYEISNFARTKKYCRHNLAFWEGKDYLGFGLGATSRVSNKIIKNTDDFEKYLGDKYTKQSEHMTESEINNFMLLARLRLDKSFKDPLLTATGSTDIPEELIDGKLVTPAYKLTTKGRLMYNQVVKRLL